ncbi:hypothetical protein MJ904_22060 [Massilia sp. MB5]|uniref:hypothetical protein n=1 Tax=Massilia sp. MB5 TaxID=2919578 RepID=UPI001F0D16C6|nr:hypothetical protein [Massilia sp. MB5]UMR33413.1 hypothetical protein MJ904_22060 [Massilia sp. MB5]
MLFGDAGDDSLVARSGNGHLLSGGDGNDSLQVESGQSDLLDGGLGDDQLVSLAQRSALWGGGGNDRLEAANEVNFLYGGLGNDTVIAGGREDMVAYNAGDGYDVVQSRGSGKTLSLGNGVAFDAVTLTRTGDDLLLGIGAGSVTLEDWYLVAAGPKQFTQLQWILDGSAEFNPGAPETMRQHKIATFDFAALVADFDQALAANPVTTAWHISSALAKRFTDGSDTSALGGDLALMAGRQAGAGVLDPLLASAALDSANFGKQRQLFT